VRSPVCNRKERRAQTSMYRAIASSALKGNPDF
jgi:hypothetical protein